METSTAQPPPVPSAPDPMPAACRVRRRHTWTLCFLFLLALYLTPLWLFRYFPSQDSPSHLDSAVALSRLADDPSALDHEFYFEEWRLAPNQLYHLLLVTLGSLLPFLVIEKLTLSFYVVGMLLAMLFAIRSTRSENSQAVFLMFPMLYSNALLMGFFNSSLGLVLFLVVLGFYFRHIAGPTPSSSLVIAIVLSAIYFVHPVPAGSAILTIGIISGARFLGNALVDPWRRHGRSQRLSGPAWREFAFSVLSLGLPTLLLLSFPSLETRATEELGTRGRFPSLTSTARKILPELDLDLRTQEFNVMITYSKVDSLTSVPWNLLLAGLACTAVYRMVRARKIGPEDSILVSAFAFWVIVLLVPDVAGGLGYVKYRATPYVYMLLILWLATKRLTPGIWRHATILAIMLAAAHQAYRIPIFAILNGDLAEFTSAAHHIEDDSTVLAHNLEPRTFRNALGQMRGVTRLAPMSDAVGYIGLERRIVNLRNYQAVRSYFPIHFRTDRNPYAVMGEALVDVHGYMERTGCPVNYVLLWGSLPEHRDHPRLPALLAQLADGYELVHVSEPRGLMRVYRLKADRFEGSPDGTDRLCASSP